MAIPTPDTSRPNSVTIRKPYDMHHHLRTGEILCLVMPLLTRRFAGGIIMPNLDPPVTTAEAAYEYLMEIQAENHTGFNPLMTLYLTDTLDPLAVRIAKRQAQVVGVKYYPRGLTTNSDRGVENPADLWTRGTQPYQVLRTLAEEDMVLLLHAADGFTPDNEEVDPYDQEKQFIEYSLPQIRDAHPELKISLEHLSTIQGVRYMKDFGDEKLGCSITAQHLLLDRRDVHRGGFNPHKFWWPIIQRKEHKEALRDLVAADYNCVYLGSDSAPHPVGKKESSCCSGGVLMAHAGIELYAEIFDELGAMEHFERFASINGPQFYGIAPSDETITLVREEWTVLNQLQGGIRPFRMGESVKWKLAD